MEKWADIPLSDHLITTAAISASMARAYEELGEKFSPLNSKFLWVTGDFSGIQKFIFGLSQESDKNIAKLLRGRSFAVNMLTVLAARMITDACELPALNTLSVAAGKFQILLPDTTQVRTKLDETRDKIVSWLFAEYFGELRIVIDGGVSFELEEFHSSKFPDVMKRSVESINKSKMQVFNQVLVTPETWINTRQYNDMHSETGMCKICGREPAIQGQVQGYHCRKFIKWGEELVDANYVTIQKSTVDFDLFGTFMLKLMGAKEDRTKNKDADIFYKTGDFTQTPGQKGFAELHFACVTPVVEKENADENEEKTKQTFEKIAEKATGLEALAMLKADVDNLGFIFSQGLKDCNTISRRNALSRSVNWFFAGYLPTMLKQKEFENIYTLFAGGDDLCLIGPWDAIIYFAVELQKKFSEFTASNPQITISAGIQLFHKNYPVSKAIEQAEALLEESKHAGRNRLTLFGQTMEWGAPVNAQVEFDKNWEVFKNKKEEENGAKSSTMLYRFYRYWRNWKDIPEEKIEKLRHRFLFIYDINRNLKPKKDEKDWRNEKPFTDLLSTHTENLEKQTVFENLGVGISMAMYKARNNKKGGFDE